MVGQQRLLDTWIFHRMIVFVKKVEEENLRHMDEFRNKKVRIVNESRLHKVNQNYSTFKMKKNCAPSYASAPSHRNKDAHHSQISQNL